MVPEENKLENLTINQLRKNEARASQRGRKKNVVTSISLSNSEVLNQKIRKIQHPFLQGLLVTEELEYTCVFHVTRIERPGM
ncbi:MAG: hypothetical protein U0T81_08880 [Saprospiraceae bacterium]